MRSIQQLTVLLGLTLLAAAGPGPLAAQSEKSRTGRGLVALYDFQLESGPLVKDRSGLTPALDLRIANPQVVRRTSGTLEVRGSTTIGSEKPPVRLFHAIRQSGAITVEAWIRPARTDQEGPARIVSFSKSPNQRNFTLGQEFETFDFRLRTSSTSTNSETACATSTHIQSTCTTTSTQPTHVATFTATTPSVG